MQYALQSAAFGLEDKVRELLCPRASRSIGPVVLEATGVEKTFRIPDREPSGMPGREGLPCVACAWWCVV